MTNTNQLRHRLRLVAASAFFLVIAAAPAQAEQGEQAMRSMSAITSASGIAASPSFSIFSCIDANGPVGFAASSSFRTHIGCGALFSTAFDDDDGDSVASSIERAIANGDGNHDGSADAVQRGVASLAIPGSRMTAEVIGSGCVIRRAEGVRKEELPADEARKHPWGMLRLHLACTAATADLKLFFHDATQWPPLDYRAATASAGEPYISLPFTFGTLDGSPFVSITISDGGLGDMSAAEGEIVVLSGPAAGQRPRLIKP